jgi:hypothetical protein
MCPNCKYPIAVPLQSILSEGKETYCRKCGQMLKIITENDISKFEVKKQDINHKCVDLCNHFRFGICTNENMLDFFNKTVSILPTEGCKELKRKTQVI